MSLERITYRYEGGPLDGQTAYHRPFPANPDEATLHRHETTPKGSLINMVAQGLYRINERPLPPPFELPPEPPADAPEEVKQQMTQAREKAAEVLAKSVKIEWVAVHQKSEQDEDWHPPPPPPAPEKPKGIQRQTRRVLEAAKLAKQAETKQ